MRSMYKEVYAQGGLTAVGDTNRLGEVRLGLLTVSEPIRPHDSVAQES